MKNILTVLSLFCFLSCSSQDLKHKKETLLVLDSIIKIAKKHSVYTKNANWDRLKKEMNDIELKADSSTSIIAPVKYMLKKLGDTHGYLMINNVRHAQIGVSHNNEIRKANPIIAQKLYQRMSRKKISSKLLNNNIAYIEIPMVINNNLAVMNKIRKAICSLKLTKPKGWIIDLRTNMGGNLYPMAAGIGELIPNLPFGGGTKDGINYNLKWEIKNGNFYMDNIPMTETPLDCETVSSPEKIAVLTSRYTASSGEAIASGLKSHQKIKLFGEQTIGASTTINWYPINKKITFCPTIDYYMSEDKTVHKDGIIPDVLIQEKLPLKNLTQGATINAAIDWLIKE
jgi:C-terminal processing protease CtpA/Prc